MIAVEHSATKQQHRQAACVAVADSSAGGLTQQAAAAADGKLMVDVSAASAEMLGLCAQPGGTYDVSMSGPPLPPCEDDR